MSGAPGAPPSTRRFCAAKVGSSALHLCGAIAFAVVVAGTVWEYACRGNAPALPKFSTAIHSFRRFTQHLHSAAAIFPPHSASAVALWIQRNRVYDAAWCFPARRAAKGIAESSWPSDFGTCGNASFAAVTARAIAAGSGANSDPSRVLHRLLGNRVRRSRDGRGVGREPLRSPVAARAPRLSAKAAGAGHPRSTAHG